jgi:hypothetical protein
MSEKVHTYDGETTMECELVEYDFSPAEMEVFSIATHFAAGSQLTSHPWLRRVIVISIGVALLAAYIWLRKKRRVE